MQNTTLSAVFEFAETTPLDEAQEAALIVAAKAGDESAVMGLAVAYGPALRAAVSNFGRGVAGGRDPFAGSLGVGTSALDSDDVEQTALLALLEVIAEHDPEVSPRLAGTIRRRLSREFADLFEGAQAFRVPERTLSRFYGILAAADGDEERAEEIAPSYSMSRETFRDVLAAVRHTGSLDERLDDSAVSGAPVAARPVYAVTPVTDAEDAVLVAVAFGAVEDDEERICRLSYGFTEYDPQPDAEVAHRMGLSRPAVQRKRAKALTKMRKALSVAE